MCKYITTSRVTQGTFACFTTRPRAPQHRTSNGATLSGAPSSQRQKGNIRSGAHGSAAPGAYSQWFGCMEGELGAMFATFMPRKNKPAGKTKLHVYNLRIIHYKTIRSDEIKTQDDHLSSNETSLIGVWRAAWSCWSISSGFLISSCTSDIFWHFPQSQEPQRKARMSVCH